MAAVALGDAMAESPIKSDWLQKRGLIRQSWKRRLFALFEDRLEYRRKQSDRYPAGTIGLAGASVHVNESSETAEDSFLEISCPQQARIFVLRGGRRLVTTWQQALQSQIDQLDVTAASHMLHRSASLAGKRKGRIMKQAPAPILAAAPLTTETSHVTTFKHGWMLKKGVGNRSWKKRYMVLRMGRLDYYLSAEHAEREDSTGCVVLSEGVSLLEEDEADPTNLRLIISAPLQGRVFKLKGPSDEMQAWWQELQARHQDPRPPQSLFEPSKGHAAVGSSTDTARPPAAKDVTAKNSLLGDQIRKLAAGPRLCKMFCNGAACQYCTDVKWTGTDQAIDGIFSTWVSNDILALSRPTQLALRKHGLLAALLSHNIRCMINLQEKGEHATCGEGNLPDGFSYSVPDFVDNGIDVHVFGWIDFGVPTMDTCLTMVKVIASAVAGGFLGSLVWSCEETLLTAGDRAWPYWDVDCLCLSVYAPKRALDLSPRIILHPDIYIYLQYTGDQAISFVRLRRPGSIQTRRQVQFVKDFAMFLRPLRTVIPSTVTQDLGVYFQHVSREAYDSVTFQPNDAVPEVAQVDELDLARVRALQWRRQGLSLHQLLRNQTKLLLETEPEDFRKLPLLVHYFTDYSTPRSLTADEITSYLTEVPTSGQLDELRNAIQHVNAGTWTAFQALPTAQALRFMEVWLVQLADSPVTEEDLRHLRQLEFSLGNLSRSCGQLLAAMACLLHDVAVDSLHFQALTAHWTCLCTSCKEPSAVDGIVENLEGWDPQLMAPLALTADDSQSQEDATLANSPLHVVVSSQRTLQDAFAFAQRLVLLASAMQTASQPSEMVDYAPSLRPRQASKPALWTYDVQLSDVEDDDGEAC